MGADSDGGDVQLLGDLGSDVAGDHLHEDREGAGFLDGAGVGQHPLGRITSALNAVAAERVLVRRRSCR